MQRYVTVQPTAVWVRGDAQRVLGSVLALPGGTELVDADGNGALLLVDPYLPPVMVWRLDATPLRPLADGERGPRAEAVRADCAHERTKRGGRRLACLPCYYKRWTARAEELGMDPARVGLAAKE